MLYKPVKAQIRHMIYFLFMRVCSMIVFILFAMSFFTAFSFFLPFDELFSCYRLLPYYHLQLLAHRPGWQFFTQKIWITAIRPRIFHVTGSKFQLHWLLSHGSSLLFHPLSCFGCWAPYEQQFHQNNLQFYFNFF